MGDKIPEWAINVPHAREIKWENIQEWSYYPNGPGPAPCLHIPILVFRDKSIGRLHHFQCRECGRRLSQDVRKVVVLKIGGASKKSEETGAEHRAKISAYWDGWDKKRARHLAVLNTIQREKSFDKEAYLASSAWKIRRDAAVDRDGGCCVICNSANDLQVHHRTYERLGSELPGDLTTLCGECHAHFHFKLPQFMPSE